MWKKYLGGSTIGEIGIENGIIIYDEVYDDGCRITLEKCKEYYTINCGVYGSMMHTAFAGEDNYQNIYDLMKRDLQEFLEKETTKEEENEFYDNFTMKY